MQLTDLNKPYGFIASLGSDCFPAIQLRNRQLRKTSSPIDWMTTPSTRIVANLLSIRFSGFMELANLSIVEANADTQTYIVQDRATGVMSYHDFALSDNAPDCLHTYPEFRAKLDRRIARFYEALQLYSPILLVRSNATWEDTVYLQTILRAVTKQPVHLLIVNKSPVGGITVRDWGLEGVCAVETPSDPDWIGANPTWGYDVILQRIRLK